MPSSTYFKKYQNLLEVLQNQGVDLKCEPGLVKSKLNSFNPIVQKIDNASRQELFNERKKPKENTSPRRFF